MSFYIEAAWQGLFIIEGNMGHYHFLWAADKPIQSFIHLGMIAKYMFIVNFIS